LSKTFEKVTANIQIIESIFLYDSI